MRAAGLTDDPHYPEYLQNAIGRTARTRKSFGRPTTQSDRLFQAGYDHPAGASSCDRCQAEWEETRGERKDNDPQPHYGVIASGNKVIRHGRTREQLRLETGALCFEMEAAGLMLDFPCIVIRGVCDYADSHKNKEWHGYAALAAAAYTKELLGYVPVGHVSQESLVVDICNELKAEIQGTNQRLDQARSQQELHHRQKVALALTDQQNRCLQTFKISSYEEQKNINPRKVEGTCVWASQSAEFIRWSKSSCNDLLWVSADPGCGKSVLSRSIIEDCLETACPEVTVCYFFFKDNDEQNLLALALCSVLHQLFSQRPQLLRHAIPVWEKNGEKLRQEVDELWRTFTTAVLSDELCKTICIFDALDECREADQVRLIEKLNSFQRQSSSLKKDAWLKFLVTSRPYDHIQDHFRAMTTSFPHLHLKGEEENDQIHKEIDIVVRTRVSELAETARLSPDVTQRLEQQLLQMEHRTYLWLYLAMDDIQFTFENSIRPAEESIQMIPPSVNDAYNKILSRVPSAQLDTVRKVLQIIVAARRPLTTEEMAMALGIATSPELRTVEEAGLDSSLIHQKLRRLCGLFVFVKNSKFYLIHQTAREFLLAESNLNEAGLIFSWRLSEAEDQIARVCMRYLLMKDPVCVDGGISSQSKDFLNYSATHWPDHVRKMDLTSDHEVKNQLHRLYNLSGKLYSLWFPIFWKEARPYDRLPAMKALHLASFNGHEQELHYQLAIHINDINVPDDTGGHAIVWGSLNGHDKIVQLLLEHGADVNAQGGDYGNALYAACDGGHEKIVQLLLDHGANVNALGGPFGNALYAACSGGYNKIVQLLLEHGADVNAQGGHFRNALYAACDGGHGQIVQLLLEHGANVNALGGPFGNALYAACDGGHGQIVQLLLEHGADVNAQGGHFRNALYAACDGGHGQIVQLLLEHGANVNALGGDYGNALYAACDGGHDQIVQLLLEHGADVNGNILDTACSRGHDKIVQLLLVHGVEFNGYSLYAACNGGHNKIVQLLLEHGADVNAQGGLFGNALYAACSGGHDKIVQLLLEHGADVNTQGGLLGNALDAAFDGGHDKIVQLLLEHGANVNGSTLYTACDGGHDRIVQLMLEHGADVNAQGGDYGNALYAACDGGHEKIVQLLLKHGADVNALGGLFRNSALYAACSGGYNKIVQLLLEHGADVNAQGSPFGDSALYAACSGGYNKIVQLLLEHGADVNAQGGHFRNALYAACVGDHSQIEQLLLEHGADVDAQDVDAQGGLFRNALYAGGHDNVVQLLPEHGADFDTQGGLLGPLPRF
ncbi:unnamed protein product [Penicillium pancosmium]